MNANLVKAVTAAYQSQAAQVDFATPISKVLGVVQKTFEKRAQESLAKNRANQAKITGFNQKEVDQLTVFKEEYDDVARKLANPLLGRKKKQELNAQLNAVNEKTSNFITGVNKNIALQSNAIDVADSRSGQYNMQQKMFIDRAQVGDYRNEWTVDEAGNVMVQDPMGDGGFKNVLDFEPIKSVNIDWLNSNTNLINTTTDLANDLSRSKSQVEGQVKNLVSNNYMSDPTAIFDTEAVASGDFANYLADNEKFQAIVDTLPENDDFDRMLAAGDSNEDFHSLIYEIAKSKVDVKEFWIDFSTQKQMAEFDNTRARKINSLETKGDDKKGNNDKVYNYNSGQYTFRPSEITSEYKSLSNMKEGDTRAWPFGDPGTTVSVKPTVRGGNVYILEKRIYPKGGDDPKQQGTTVKEYSSLDELWMANLGVAAPEQYMTEKSKLP
jgi:hypothetical protein